jgi:predicted  nucleic acid-binding Zn ribbon protein
MPLLDDDVSEAVGSVSNSMSSAERAAARRRKQKATLNDRLLAEISEVESDLYRAGKVRAADIPVQKVRFTHFYCLDFMPSSMERKRGYFLEYSVLS